MDGFTRQLSGQPNGKSQIGSYYSYYFPHDAESRATIIIRLEFIFRRTAGGLVFENVINRWRAHDGLFFWDILRWTAFRDTGEVSSKQV